MKTKPLQTPANFLAGLEALNRKRVLLEVNACGTWRRVMDFDAGDELASGAVLEHAHQLLVHSLNPKLKARLIMPGELDPLMSWDRGAGFVAVELEGCQR